jgi:hypothetical protein
MDFSFGKNRKGLNSNKQKLVLLRTTFFSFLHFFTQAWFSVFMDFSFGKNLKGLNSNKQKLVLLRTTFFHSCIQAWFGFFMDFSFGKNLKGLNSKKQKLVLLRTTFFHSFTSSLKQAWFIVWNEKSPILSHRTFACAHDWIRTSTPNGTTPSRWHVYQFHHVGKAVQR